MSKYLTVLAGVVVAAVGIFGAGANANHGPGHGACEDPTIVVGSGGPTETIGTPGDDVILGGKGQDTIRGLGGDDRLCGNKAQDKLVGGDGDDILAGGHSNDKLLGNAGDDVARGGAATDLCNAEKTSNCEE
jgi:Ca2+-binding RTX toxin-like protein